MWPFLWLLSGALLGGLAVYFYTADVVSYFRERADTLAGINRLACDERDRLQVKVNALTVELVAAESALRLARQQRRTEAA